MAPDLGPLAFDWTDIRPQTAADDIFANKTPLNLTLPRDGASIAEILRPNPKPPNPKPIALSWRVPQPAAAPAQPPAPFLDAGVLDLTAHKPHSNQRIDDSELSSLLALYGALDFHPGVLAPDEMNAVIIAHPIVTISVTLPSLSLPAAPSFTPLDRLPDLAAQSELTSPRFVVVSPETLAQPAIIPSISPLTATPLPAIVALASAPVQADFTRPVTSRPFIHVARTASSPQTTSAPPTTAPAAPTSAQAAPPQTTSTVTSVPAVTTSEPASTQSEPPQATSTASSPPAVTAAEPTSTQDPPQTTSTTSSPSVTSIDSASTPTEPTQPATSTSSDNVPAPPTTITLSGSFQFLEITDTGPSWEGIAVITLSGGTARLYSDDTQTLDHLTPLLSGNDDALLQQTTYATWQTTGQHGTLTLGPDFLLIQTSGQDTLGTTYDTWDDAYGSIVNQGSIEASGGSLTITGASFINQGSIAIADDETVSITAAQWSNQGLITIGAGSTLMLGGSYSADAIQGIVNDGGELLLSGSIDGGALSTAGAELQNATLENLAITGLLSIAAGGSATIGSDVTWGSGAWVGQNASLALASAQTLDDLTITLSGGLLDAVTAWTDYAALGFSGVGDTLTLGPDFTLQTTSTATLETMVAGATRAVGSIVNQGSIDDLSGQLTVNTFDFDNQGQLTVDGTLVMAAGSWSNEGLITIAGTLEAETSLSAGGTIALSGGTLQLDPGVGVASAAIEGYGTIDAASFINQGSIIVAGGTLTIASPSFTNQGTIEVTSGATLLLANGITNNGTITIDAGGTLALGGTITTLAGIANQGQLVLEGAVQNLTLDAGASLAFDNTSLSNVTVQGTAYVTGSLTIGSASFTGSNGSGNGAIDLSAALIAEDSLNLNRLTITLHDGAGLYQDTDQATFQSSGAGKLTLGAQAVVIQADGDATLGVIAEGYDSGQGAITNKGTIDAFAAQGLLTIAASQFDNRGTIAIANGDTLLISSSTWSNEGRITIGAGSSLVLAGGVTAADLNSAIINNGGSIVIETTVTGISLAGDRYDWQGAVLASDTLTTVLALTGPNETLTLGTGNVFDAGVAVNGATLLIASQINNVTITLDGGNSAIDAARAGTSVTFGSGTSITQTSGTTSLGPAAYGDADGVVISYLINQGSITAAAADGLLQIVSYGFDNQGNITIANGDTLQISVVDFSNEGTITVEAGSTLDLGGDLSGADLSHGIVNQGGTVEISGNLADQVFAGNYDWQAAYFFDDAITSTLAITAQGGSVYDVGDLEFLGGITIGSAGADNHDALYVDGSQSFQGAGITLSGYDSGIYQYTEASLYAANGAGTMDFDAGTVIDQTDGTAVIGVVDEAWDNGDGIIVNQGLIEAEASSGNLTIEASQFDNEGSISVTNGDTLLIDAASLAENGQILVGAGSSARLETAALIGSGTIMLAGGEFEFATSGAVSLDVQFTAPGGELILDDPRDFDGTISGFGPGDSIDLAGFDATSVSYANGMLAVVSGSAVVQIALAGVSGHLQFLPDGHGGSLIAAR